MNRREGEMRLVSYDDRRGGLLPPGERLDGTNLDGLLGIRAGMAPLHDADAIDPFGGERGDGLVDQIERRNREDDAAALGARAANYVSR